MQRFDERCYALLKTVPKGKVTTYKEIAHALGSRAYRAVGNAMNRNPHAPRIPCHRVVQTSGIIGGYAYGTPKKIALLRKEGILISKNKVVDLKRFLFKW